MERAAAEQFSRDPRPGGLRVLDSDPAGFRERFGRVPFALHHKLASSGLFTIARLTAIAESMIATGRGDRVAIFGDAQGPGDQQRKRKRASAAAVARLESANYWIAFINISEADPELGAVYRETLQDVEALLGVPLIRDVTRGHMNVFVASPNVITPYHIDHEHNFLCQVTSDKDVWLWDPSDRENLSEMDIERFYCGDMGAARYKPDTQHRAHQFHIGPGDAIYHPPLAPHWVKNGPGVSISVSVGFFSTILERHARIYQANRYLRRAGITPPPPGHSRVLDSVRVGATAIRRWKVTRARRLASAKAAREAQRGA